MNYRTGEIGTSESKQKRKGLRSLRVSPLAIFCFCKFEVVYVVYVHINELFLMISVSMLWPWEYIKFWKIQGQELEQEEWSKWRQNWISGPIFEELYFGDFKNLKWTISLHRDCRRCLKVYKMVGHIFIWIHLHILWLVLEQTFYLRFHKWNI